MKASRQTTRLSSLLKMVYGEKIARFYGDSDMKVLNYGLKKEFLDRYDVEDVLKDNRLDAEMIAEDVKGLL